MLTHHSDIYLLGEELVDAGHGRRGDVPLTSPLLSANQLQCGRCAARTCDVTRFSHIANAKKMCLDKANLQTAVREVPSAGHHRGHRQGKPACTG